MTFRLNHSQHIPLRKHTYSNILKTLLPKMKIFRYKNSDIFHISAQKHRLWVLGEAVLTSTHNLCFLSRNKKNNVYPCKPQFYYIKVGFKGSTLYRYVFVMQDHPVHSVQSDLFIYLFKQYLKRMIQ